MKIDVDNQHGFVELVDWMTVNPSEKITDAARVSYDRDGAHDAEKDARLIARLAKDGHWSPFRHSPVTLMVSCPEFVARQWYKHVVGSTYAFVDTGWNEVSQRYSEVLHAYYPDVVHVQSSVSKQGSAEAMDELHAKQLAASIEAFRQSAHTQHCAKPYPILRRCSQYDLRPSLWSSMEGLRMILHDVEIERLAHAGMIENFAPCESRPDVISYGLTSFGYDMRVADEWMEYANDTVDPKNRDAFDVMAVRTYKQSEYVIGAGEFVLCRSVEKFAMPEDVIGIVVGKSTYARCGLIINCTPMEPGWRGELTIEIHNASLNAVKIYANEGIAQVMFFRGDRPRVTYSDKRGKYQDQSGVTLPRMQQ